MLDTKINNFIFFSLSNFEISGGTISRSIPLLNALSKKKNVTLVSNINNSKVKLDAKIDLFNIDVIFNKFEKIILIISVSFFGCFLSYLLFYKKMKRIGDNLKLLGVNNKEIFSVGEYIDHIILFILSKNKIIKEFSLDVHGISHTEFKSKKNYRIIFSIFFYKDILAKIIDKKIYSNATKLIVLSKEMQAYLSEKYYINNSKFYIIPDGIDPMMKKVDVSKDKINEYLNFYNIPLNKKIIFFCGEFKDSSGVDFLIRSYNDVLKKNKDIFLIIAGGGELEKKYFELVSELGIQDCCLFTGRVPFYNDFFIFAKLSNILVCPDLETPISEMCIHTKYLNAVFTNKIVINSYFKIYDNINLNNRFSINYNPSIKNDLYEKIMYSVKNYKSLKNKYSQNNLKIFDLYNYDNLIKPIID